MFSYENISQNKEMLKSTNGLEADGLQTVFEFFIIQSCKSSHSEVFC